jgi:hypothetical protein
MPDPGVPENEYTRRGQRRRARINREIERANLAADIARLERELGIAEPGDDGIDIHEDIAMEWTS